MRYLLIILCFTSFLIGCAAQENCDHRCQADLVIKECERKQGYAIVGGINGPLCVEEYEDGGKVCSDSSECRGICTAIWSDLRTKDSEVVGKCSYYVTGSCTGFVVVEGKFGIPCVEE